MITFIKTNTKIGNRYVIEICKYYKSDTHDEDLEKWKSDKRIFGKGPPPISGGPIIAYFPEEYLADEYIKFKTEQLELINKK